MRRKAELPLFDPVNRTRRQMRVRAYLRIIFPAGLERIEPSKQIPLTPPAGRSPGPLAYLFEGLALGLQIGLGVVIGGVQVCMPQQILDYEYIDSRSHQMDSR